MINTKSALFGLVAVLALHAPAPAIAAANPCHARNGECPAEERDNWAGVQVNGDYKSIRAEWKVPKVFCDKSPNGGETDNWIGFGAGNDWKTPLNQIGTSGECEDGKAGYWAWWEPFPADQTNIHHPVHPGDHVVAHIKLDSKGQNYAMTLENKSKRWKETFNLVGPPDGMQVEVITELQGKAAATEPTTYEKVLVDGRPILDHKHQVFNAHEGDICAVTKVDKSRPGTVTTSVDKT